MQRSLLWLRVLLLPLDLLAIGLAISVAYVLRSPANDVLFFASPSAASSLTNLAEAHGLVLPLASYLRLFIISWPLWIVAFAERGLYDLRTHRGLLSELGRIIMAVTVGLTISLSLLFVTHTIDVSRVVVFHTWWLSIAFIFLIRLVVRIIEQLLWTANRAVNHVALYGAPEAVKRAMLQLDSQRDRPWRYAGRLGDRNFGRVEDLPSLASRGKVDELWLLEAESGQSEVQTVLALAATSGLTVRLLPASFDVVNHAYVAEEVLGLPLLRVQRTPLEGWGHVVKRLMDMTFAALLLLVLSPVALLIVVLIKLDSVGPVIFRQQRIGEQGKLFWFFKFRSMRVGADLEHQQLIAKHGNMFKLKEDPRQTTVGRFLRKSSLDELPQLWNVLRGDMSLVGPRPPLPEEVERYSVAERRRLGIKPGLTGLWQVSGRSLADGQHSFADWVALDAYYIEHWSLWLDLSILLRTAVVLLTGKGAY